MSEIKHTPGPWTFGYYGCNGYCINGSGQHIATSILYKKGGGEANARLIATAPELLEALKAVVSVADRATVEFDMARAAISKATGEQE